MTPRTDGSVRHRAQPWPLAASLPPLAALPTAPSCARNLVALTLPEWGLRPLLESAALVISELVTNAIAASTALQPIRVCLLSDYTQLVLEVWDEAPGFPLRRESGDLEEFGRGLALVDALVSDWGWRQVTGRPGKCVFAVLSQGVMQA